MLPERLIRGDDTVSRLSERVRDHRHNDQVPHDADESKVMTVNGAAAYLGVSPGFIRRLVAERRIVHYKVGRRVMFRREEIDQFIDQGKRETPDDVPWQLRGHRGRSPRTSR